MAPLEIEWQRTFELFGGRKVRDVFIRFLLLDIIREVDYRHSIRYYWIIIIFPLFLL